jgi:hypothetical protein
VLIARDINLVLVHDHRSGTWLMAESSDEGWIMAAATAIGGGEASASWLLRWPGGGSLLLVLQMRWTMRGGSSCHG